MQAGSGSSWRAPHDIKTDEYLEECKYTDGNKFALDAVYWDGLRTTAMNNGRLPRMVIDFEAFGIRLVVTEEDRDE